MPFIWTFLTSLDLHPLITNLKIDFYQVAVV